MGPLKDAPKPQGHKYNMDNIIPIYLSIFLYIHPPTHSSICHNFLSDQKQNIWKLEGEEKKKTTSYTEFPIWIKKLSLKSVIKDKSDQITN